MTEADRLALINAIALREGNIKQLCAWYDMTTKELRAFLEEYEEDIQAIRWKASEREEEEHVGIVTPSELGELWISNKLERLARYQTVADKLYKEAMEMGPDATVLRELRFYMTAAANELGQLLHRGSGETGSDSLSVDIQGVDLDNIR